MDIPYPVDEPCVECGDGSDVWAFKKYEGTIIKECFTCDTCGCEWTEVEEK